MMPMIEKSSCYIRWKIWVSFSLSARYWQRKWMAENLKLEQWSWWVFSKVLHGWTVARDLDILAILQINSKSRLVWFTLLTFITVCLLGLVKRMIKISSCLQCRHAWRLSPVGSCSSSFNMRRKQISTKRYLKNVIFICMNIMSYFTVLLQSYGILKVWSLHRSGHIF